MPHRPIFVDDLHRCKFGDHPRCPSIVDSQQVEQFSMLRNELVPFKINRNIRFPTNRTNPYFRTNRLSPNRHRGDISDRRFGISTCRPLVVFGRPFVCRGSSSGHLDFYPRTRLRRLSIKAISFYIEKSASISRIPPTAIYKSLSTLR